MRAFRRQLRAWREDFLAVWGRLTTFHRVALGICLAIAIIYAGREWWTDPLQAQVNAARTEFQESDPPSPIPTIETDEEIAESVTKIDGRKGTVGQKKKEMEQAIAGRPQVTAANREHALAEFTTLFSKNSLMLLAGGPAADTPAPAAAKSRSTKASSRKATPAKTPAATAAGKDEPPMKSEKYDYRLEGTFENIFAFLNQVAEYKYPAKLSDMKIFVEGTPEPDTAVAAAKPPAKTPVSPVRTGPPKLHLEFRLTIYMQD